MEHLIDRLESAVAIVATYIHELRHSHDFESGFGQYVSILESSAKRYQHRSGRNVNRVGLQRRYEHETALLHILTDMFARNMQQVCGRSLLWPVFDQANPYSWYRLHSSFSNTIEQLAAQLRKVESPELVVTQISDCVLETADRRQMGEYYTPPPIARHLVESSGFEPPELMAGKRLIDRLTWLEISRGAWHPLDRLSPQAIGPADVDGLHIVKDVQLGDRQSGRTVQPNGVPKGHKIQPTAAARTSCSDPEFPSSLPKAFSARVAEFSRERPLPDAGRIRLENPDSMFDRGKRDADRLSKPQERGCR